MKRNFRHRRLAYEQLESKAAPSSILLVVSGDSTDTEFMAQVTSSIATGSIATSSIATGSSLAGDCRYETEQILRFVAANTTDSEQSHRSAALPTAGQCAAADEMMKLAPSQWNSLHVLGFYDDGIEL